MTEHDKINAELHRLDCEAQALDAEIDATLQNMQKVADESNCVADVAHNAPEILDDIDREFEEKTSLDKIDVAFLFLAAALQCVRWYLLPNIKYRLTSEEGDKLVRKITPKKWQDILLAPVPYDAIQDGVDVEAGLGGVQQQTCAYHEGEFQASVGLCGDETCEDEACCGYGSDSACG